MSKQLVFIDDAGDPGFKIGRGSSNFFVISAVFFDDNLDAEETAHRIKRLRRALDWHDLHEFKFRKTSAVIRQKFFETVRFLDFRAVVAIIDKNFVMDMDLRNNPSRFYHAVILQAIKAGGSLQKSHVYIDGEKGNDYRRKVKNHFRQSLPMNTIQNLTFKDSKVDNLIQLADMIAGAALHSTEERDDAKVYIKLIKERISATITTI